MFPAETFLPVCGTLGDCRAPTISRRFATLFSSWRCVVNKKAMVEPDAPDSLSFPAWTDAQRIPQRSLDRSMLSD
jgi:hypothetical protein